MEDILILIGSYLKNNLRDIINICFWIITSIVAILTYRNAKKTLFNPIRTEMVKYQMKVITDFIDNHTGKGMNLEYSLDYLSLVKINYDVNYLLDIYKNERSFESHVFDDLDREVIKYCEDNLVGLFEVMKKGDTYYFDSTATGDYHVLKQYVQTRHVKVKEEANKDLPLQRLFFTKKFYNFYSDLLNLQTNPFIPKEIKVHVDKIMHNITGNLGLLYETLAVHIPAKQSRLYRDIYAHFQPNKIDHQQDLTDLRNAINKYFKVDKV